MKILGLGIDLTECSRMEAAIQKHGDSFLHRIFTEQELGYCSAMRNPVPHYAARFAAKEAVSKAFGTGIGAHMGWKDIEIVRLASGQPAVQLHGPAADLARSMGVDSVLLSLTHSEHASAANAIAISSKG
jgi:holo-[acyl-carrier protein] synthase